MKFWTSAMCATALLGAVACESEEAASKSKAPTFNYIPLNENVCELPDDPTAQVVIANRLQALSSSRKTAAALKLSICSDCAEDQLGPLLASVNKPIKLGNAEVAPPFTDLVNAALGYPYRELLLSWDVAEDGATTVALVQGIPTGTPEAHSYFVQAETLDKDCKAFHILVGGTATETKDAEGDVDKLTFETSDPAANPFGFQVPTTLPPLTLTPDEIAAQIAANAGINLRLGKPEVTFEVDGSGAGKGTIAGWIEPGEFEAFAQAGVDLAPYTDPNANAIRAVLRFELASATVQAEIPSLAIAGIAPEADEGDTLPATVVHPRPPADKLGLAADCVDCVHLPSVTAKLCNDTDVPRDFLLLQSKSGRGTFQIKVTDGDGKLVPKADVRIVRHSLGAVGGALSVKSVSGPAQIGVSVALNVPARRGVLPKVPMCATYFQPGATLPKTFNDAQGWEYITYAPTRGVAMGCAKTIALCVDYREAKCKLNEEQDSLGGCQCKAGFAQVGADCVSAQGLPKLPAGAVYVRDAETGAVEVDCPDDDEYFAKSASCMPDPCENEDACLDSQECEVDDDTGAKVCVDTDDDEPVPQLTQAARNKLFLQLKKAAGGKFDSADEAGYAAEVASGEDYESAGSEVEDEVEDTDDDKADVSGLRKLNRTARKPNLLSLKKFKAVSKKTPMRIPPLKGRKVNGKNRPAKAPMTSFRSYRDLVVDMTIKMNALQYKEFDAARKKGLPNKYAFSYEDMRHDPKLRKYFAAAKAKTATFKAKGYTVKKGKNGTVHVSLLLQRKPTPPPSAKLAKPKVKQVVRAPAMDIRKLLSKSKFK